MQEEEGQYSRQAWWHTIVIPTLRDDLPMNLRAVRAV